ncbi:sterol esterase TGL1 [Gaeumannomyces tritici R3-111a-1]|uniref:Sterol esterase TGL1 n=1 Tax=Gaeumannomyces tritici (strain R3-111a-1) TaxID=644352 RepID=J3PD68_GAET3|nr:sterol esterase TGL1 [Gaeumannomyces tritici R3-111a-1]EJT70413.1 sterol esterase TGL1 [Gaeumannomyces tritici R3-111a-1]
MPVPFLGRLNVTEYVALVGSFILVGFEAIVRVLTLALPTSIISLFYRASRRLFNSLSSPAQKRAEERRAPISTSIRDASDFVELCAIAGYTAEEHVVQTKDGYLLGVHRLAWRKGEEDRRVNDGPNSIPKPVVYLHHGLMMNSEVWVCQTDAQRSLPFVLVDRGFDVWVGNNRGNKYSKKSIHCGPNSTQFWNFSIDEFAFYDIPDSIAYILETTRQPSLSYIGFSQGTAQAFASLAVHPKLNQQINVFIALAPAMSPAGLSNGIVDALIKASPSVLFLLFGRRSILSSATMWESILYPPIFIRLIDMGLTFLFGWRARNMSTSQKLAAYPHLYSYTSTKSVVHWFQIIRTKSFQMYDDDVHPPLSLSRSSKFTKVARYPTRNIKTPIVLVYGGSDSLVDIRVMLRELPPQTVATEIPHYEHLDFLWARDVDSQVFMHVFDALESFKGVEHTTEEYSRFRSARSTSIGASGSLRRHTYRDSEDMPLATVRVLAEFAEEQEGTTEAESDSGATLVNGRPGPVRPRLQHQATEGLRDPDSRSVSHEPGNCAAEPLEPVSPRPCTPQGQVEGAAAGTPEGEALSSPVRVSGGSLQSRSGTKHGTSRTSSNVSFNDKRGIQLGVGRAIGGVVTAAVAGAEPGNVSSGTD